MSAQLQSIGTIVDSISGQYISTIKKHAFCLVPDSQLHAAKQQIVNNDFALKLAIQNPDSLKDAIMTAAILGVDLTAGKRQGWLVPRKNGIAFQIGYKGIEQVHQSLGIIDRLSVRVVRDGDEFEWSGDDQEKPTHTADWFSQDREKKQIIGAFCVTYFPDKSIHVTSAPIEHIYTKHRNVSDTWKNEKKRHYSPWMTFPQAMIEKTMAIIASKSWPAAKMSTEQASPILEKLHETEVSDYSLEKPEPDSRFMGFFINGDALGLRLLEMEYMSDGVDSDKAKEWINLYNQFPKGYITQNKEKLINLCNTGQLILEQIEESITNEDAFQLEENISYDRHCKKLLAEYLGKEKSEIVKTMLNSID